MEIKMQGERPERVEVLKLQQHLWGNDGELLPSVQRDEQDSQHLPHQQSTNLRQGPPGRHVGGYPAYIHIRHGHQPTNSQCDLIRRESLSTGLQAKLRYHDDGSSQDWIIWRRSIKNIIKYLERQRKYEFWTLIRIVFDYISKKNNLMYI